MSRLIEPDGPDDPNDIDATFEQIVAGLRAEGVGSDSGVSERTERRERSGESDGADREAPPERPAPPLAEGWRTSDADWDATVLGTDPADDDEHFVPPEPPPLPRPRKGAFVVLLLFLVGLLLLIAPELLGLTSSVGLPVGMLALASGLTLMLLRVKQGPPDGADPDSGAQV